MGAEINTRDAVEWSIGTEKDRRTGTWVEHIRWLPDGRIATWFALVTIRNHIDERAADEG